LITLREGMHGPRLLQEAGVDMRRCVVTGDDAIELAHSARPDKRGKAIGVNLRLAEYANVKEDVVGRLGTVLRSIASQAGIPLLPIPISLQRDGEDAKAISNVLGNDEADHSITSPLDCIARVSACRVVVTGSYHAGVFALAQGIPVIGLASCEYYVDKFEGLRGQFGRACDVVRMDLTRWDQQLAEKVNFGLEQADRMRGDLLLASERQIRFGNEAYDRMKEIAVSSKQPALRNVG
jgi:colanic acid/amylovoran biosynthesis protein